MEPKNLKILFMFLIATLSVFFITESVLSSSFVTFNDDKASFFYKNSVADADTGKVLNGNVLGVSKVPVSELVQSELLSLNYTLDEKEYLFVFIDLEDAVSRRFLTQYTEFSELLSSSGVETVFLPIHQDFNVNSLEYAKIYLCNKTQEADVSLALELIEDQSKYLSDCDASELVTIIDELVEALPVKTSPTFLSITRNDDLLFQYVTTGYMSVDRLIEMDLL